MQVVSYVSGQDIASLKKNQKIRFGLNDRDNGTTIIVGKIQSISVYPETVKEQSEYEVVSIIKPTEKEKNSLRYGMQGRFLVITGKETYFNYLKSLFLDEK